MSVFQDVLKKNEATILENWLKGMAPSTRRSDLIGDAEVKRQTSELLRLITDAAQKDSDSQSENFSAVRDFLRDIVSFQVERGLTPSDTAMFVLSLKQPVFNSLRDALRANPEQLVGDMWNVGNLIDQLALITVETALQLRDQTIFRQQEEMLELSTPVVKLWDGILALPIIGTLDSARTQVVMESLLSAIVETNSQQAIIDITGVPTVDTLVAQHLIKTITAARLMGAECYLSGIRPAIAQTIVHLGINLSDIQTKAKLSDAFALALQRTGRTVVAVSTKTPSYRSVTPKVEEA